MNTEIPTKFEEPELSEPELRIWIAEKCGWKIVAPGRGFTPEGKPGGIIPDYTRDLNAMREAHRTLTERQAWDYDWQLSLQAEEHSSVASESWTWGCSALQHAKAFYAVTK